MNFMKYKEKQDYEIIKLKKVYEKGYIRPFDTSCTSNNNHKEW